MDAIASPLMMKTTWHLQMSAFRLRRCISSDEIQEERTPGTIKFQFNTTTEFEYRSELTFALEWVLSPKSDRSESVRLCCR